MDHLKSLRELERMNKLKMSDDFERSPTFNVKDLRPYHGEDLKTSLFYQLWGIDASAIPRFEDSIESIGEKGTFEDQVNWPFSKMQAASCIPRHMILYVAT